MVKKFKSRINKINSIRKKLKLDYGQLAGYLEPSLTAREVELILTQEDSIYLNEQNVIAIEEGVGKAMKVYTENLKEDITDFIEKQQNRNAQ